MVRVLTGARKKSVDNQARKVSVEKENVLKVSSREGLHITSDDAYEKLQRRRARERKERSYNGSLTTLNTLLAIKDPYLRKKIVTRRIKRLKRTILLLFILVFIISGLYGAVLFFFYDDDELTLGEGLVERHVVGTSIFELVLATWLFVIGVIRLKWPKRENIYYLTQISYLFATFHYLIMIPLNARNFHKHLANLPEMMEVQMQLGRCTKDEVSIPVQSQYKTIYAKDECTVIEKPIDLPHIRPVTRKNCDGVHSWYYKAMAYADKTNDTNHYKPQEGEVIKYDVYSQTFAHTQKKHHCCGIKHGKDWMKTLSTHYTEMDKKKLINWTNFIYPESCCKEEWRAEHLNATCHFEHVYGALCTPSEEITVLSYSLSILVLLILCGILNFTLFVLLTKYRNIVERFRPELLDR